MYMGSFIKPLPSHSRATCGHTINARPHTIHDLRDSSIFECARVCVCVSVALTYPRFILTRIRFRFSRWHLPQTVAITNSHTHTHTHTTIDMKVALVCSAHRLHVACRRSGLCSSTAAMNANKIVQFICYRKQLTQ